MADTLQVSLRINADGSGLSAVLKSAQGDVDAFASKAKAAGATAAAGLGQANSAATQLGNTIAQGASQGTAALTKLGGSVGGVTREVSVMLGELARGNFERFASSTTVLSNRLGILPALLNPIGIGFVAIAATLGVFAYGTIKAQENLDALNKTIALTNGQAGQTGDQLQSLVTQITATGTSAKDAQADVLALAASGKFAGQSLNDAALGAAAFADLTGQSIKTATEAFEKLADDPTKELVKLNDQTHLVDSSVIQLVASLQEGGNKFAATTIAVTEFSNATLKADAAAKQAAEANSFWSKIGQDATDASAAETGLGLSILKERDAANAAAVSQAKLNAARNLVNSAVNSVVDNLIGGLEKENEENLKIIATYGKGKDALLEYNLAKEKAAIESTALAAAESVFRAELNNGVNVVQALRDSYNAYSTSITTATDFINKNSVAYIANAKAAQAAIDANKKSGKDFAGELETIQEIIDRNTTSITGLAKANGDYDAGVKTLVKIESDFADAGKESGNVLDLLQAAYDALNAKKQEAIDKANAIHDAFLQEGTALDQLQKKFEDNISTLTDYIGLHDKEKLELKAAQDAEKAWQESIHQALADNDTDLADWIRANHDGFIQAAKDNADYLYDTQNTFNRIKEVRQQTISIFSSGLDSLGKSIADFATGGIKKWSDFGKALVDDTKQFIAAIIEEFLKLEVFNGIINSLFNLSGTSSELATFANLGGGSGAGGSGGAGSLLSSGSSLASLGSKLFGTGGAAGLGGATTSGSGVLAGTGFDAGAGGTAVSVGPTAAPFGGTIGGFSTGGLLGAAGGALYGSTLGSGGISTGVSTITGAVAGYAVGAAVTTAMTAGISAGLAAVPVVGWIALAALVVDKVSGGKLFGTKFQTQNTDTTLSLGATGGSASATEYETRQKALFGGIDKKTISVDPGQAAKDAASQLFDQEKAAIAVQAADLGKTAGDLVAGTFQTITDYTKKGAVKSTQTISTFLGKQYTEDLTAFTQRYAAENTISLIDQGDAAGTASKLADQYRSNAATLLDAAQTLFAVDVDLKNGTNILNDTGATLTATFTEIQKFQASSETLLQTYARLEGETQNFTALFTDVGVKISQTGDAFVQFSDDLATAFGGLQNESTALSTFYQQFFQVGNGAVNQLSAIWTAANARLTAIGETAGETTQQFAADFTAALPNLTPAEIATWVAAGNALYQATQAQATYNAALLKYSDFSESLAASAGSYTPYEDALYKINEQMQANVQQANDLAQAAGLQGASEQDLANIHSIAAQAAAAALAQLQQSTLDLISTLGLSTDANSTATSTSDAWNSVSKSASAAADAAKQLYDAQIAAIKQVNDYLQSVLLDTSVTTLTPQQRLAAAASDYDTTLAGANAGNQDDLANLTKSAQDYLDAARTFYSSSDSYTAIFNAVRDGLAQFAAHTPTKIPGSGNGGSAGGSSSGSTTTTTSTTSALQTQLNLQTLIGDIHDLLVATGTPLNELVKSLNLDLPALLKDLNINVADGTVKTTQQLATLAGQLGVPISTLAQQIGFNLGDLTKSNSLDSQALQQRIVALPKSDADALQPLFDAISKATTAADANNAIDTLTAYVNTLPEAEKEQLAPFLAGVSLDGPLDYLTTINDYGKQTATGVAAINKSLAGPLPVYIIDHAGASPGAGSGGAGSGGAGTGTGTTTPGAGTGTGTTTPGTGTGPGIGVGAGGGGGGTGPNAPVTNAVGNSIVIATQAQAQSADATNRTLALLLAEVRAMRTEQSKDSTTAARLDKVAAKLDTLNATGSQTTSAVNRIATSGSRR